MKNEESKKKKTMGFGEVLDVIRGLAGSQGFYGRLFESIADMKQHDPEQYEEFIHQMEDEGFESPIDVVLYFEEGVSKKAKEKAKETVGNYVKRQKIADEIIEKLPAIKSLTDEEKELIKSAVYDPLGEFCRREATYRLIEMHDVDPERANGLEEDARDIIRDGFEYAERLFGKIDEDLRELKAKCVDED